MKTKAIFGLITLLCMIAGTFVSCTSDETAVPQGNDGRLGSLQFKWSEQTQVGDTVMLVCNQTLVTTDDRSNQRTLYPKATIKLWPEKTQPVEYSAGSNPKPVYQGSEANKGYDGNSKRCYVIRQKITMSDGKVFRAQLSYELNSYYGNGRTLFYPHVVVDQLVFGQVTDMKQSGGLTYVELEFNAPWTTSNDTGKGTQTISISYAKKEVQEADKLLSTTFNKGFNWDNNSFQLFVEKKETWKLAGEKKTYKKSKWLPFSLGVSFDESKEVSNFRFTGTLVPTSTAKEDISADGWKLKQGKATQTLRFSNGYENFSHAFTYPLYEASIVWEGKTFDFDLSVNFNENHSVTEYSEHSAKCKTVATISLDSKKFEKTATTTLVIPEKPDPGDDPDPYPYTGPKYGKILGFYVSAVFNPALLDNGKGALAEKCVLIHYETGYEWGICGYNEDFPSSFNYTASTYGSYTSVAKHTAQDAYQLTYVQELTSSILWYDANSKLISGIDAVTCKIYGWPHVVDGKYASMFKTYSGQYSNNNYTLTITAPNGAAKTLNSSPID